MPFGGPFMNTSTTRCGDAQRWHQRTQCPITDDTARGSAALKLHSRDAALARFPGGEGFVWAGREPIIHYSFPVPHVQG
jgi:hypothetical protein